MLLTWAGEQNQRCTAAIAAIGRLIEDETKRPELEKHLRQLRTAAMGVGMIQGELAEGRYR